MATAGEDEEPLLRVAVEAAGSELETEAAELAGAAAPPRPPTTAWLEFRATTVSVKVVQLVEKTVVVGSGDEVMEAATVI